MTEAIQVLLLPIGVFNISFGVVNLWLGRYTGAMISSLVGIFVLIVWQL